MVPIVLAGWGGAVIGGLVAVIYDTSADTAALEGGRRHLTFHQGLMWMIIGAIAGGVIGLFAFAARQDFPQEPDA